MAPLGSGQSLPMGALHLGQTTDDGCAIALVYHRNWSSTACAKRFRFDILAIRHKRPRLTSTMTELTP